MVQRINTEDIKRLREDPKAFIWARKPEAFDYMGTPYHQRIFASQYRKFIKWENLQVQDMEWIKDSGIRIGTGDTLHVTWGFSIS